MKKNVAILKHSRKALITFFLMIFSVRIGLSEDLQYKYTDNQSEKNPDNIQVMQNQNNSTEDSKDSALATSSTGQSTPTSATGSCFTDEQFRKVAELKKMVGTMVNNSKRKKIANEKSVKYRGFDPLIECQKYLPETISDWKTLTENNLERITKNETWEKAFGALKNDGNINEIVEECNPNKLSQENKCEKCTEDLKNSFQADLNEIIVDIQTCAGFAVIMKGTDYDPDYNGPKVKKSVDTVISCESSGHITQDYPACASMINFYDGFFVGQKVGTAAQSVDFGLKTQELQKQALKGQNEGDYLAGLRAQEQSVRKQAKQATQQGVFHGAKLATLMGLYSKIPIMEDVAERISEHEGKIGALHSGLTEKYNFGKEKSDLVPAATTLANYQDTILKNSKARDQLKQAMVNAGVDMTVALGSAKILNNQADDIAEAMGTVESASFPDLAWDQQDLKATKCAMDPTAEGCTIAGLGDEHTLDVPDLNISGMTPNETGRYATTDEDAYPDSPDTAKTSDYTNPIGNIVSGAKQKSTFDSIGMPGALNSGSGRSSGGGGGGLGGSSGGGGGGGDDEKTGGGGSTSALTAPKYSYAQGSGGVNFSRSSGAKAKEDNKNPFGGLFGKKDEKNGNSVLNFRELASLEEKKNIFERISRRYKIVSGSNRLVEYEVIGNESPNK